MRFASVCVTSASLTAMCIDRETLEAALDRRLGDGQQSDRDTASKYTWEKERLGSFVRVPSRRSSADGG